MSITYPPEMLPQSDDAAQVVVCSNMQCCLKGENERLRAALKEIAEWPVHEDENGLRYNGPQWIAQRALEQKEDGGNNGAR